MTKRQYLEARISEVNEALGKRIISVNERRSQHRALMLYSMDLEREIARENLENNAAY